MNAFVTFVSFVAFVANVFVCFVAAQAPDAIAEIRVHGNHTTPDRDVLGIAGLTVGAAASEAALTEAKMKLRTSGRFEAVEVRRRFRSIGNPSEIIVILLVDERPGVSENDLILGPFDRIRVAGMWLPIVHHRDGHGLTYGARVSFVDPLGPRSRVSVPMTWCGERRVAVEVERTFGNGPISIVRGSVGVHRHVNPHYRLPDSRREVTLRTEHTVTPWLRAGANARVWQVEFATTDRSLYRAAGVHLAVDNRRDPSFPRNAVHATMGWERIDFDRRAAGRWRTDFHGYVGLVGSTVLALHAQARRADAALPLSEQSPLGGSDSLRAYRAGHQAGDGVVAISGEVRLPLTSPLSYGRFGVKAFADAGTAWASGERLRKQQFDRGISAGVYFGATALSAGVDVAWPERGKPRVHAGVGVTFYLPAEELGSDLGGLVRERRGEEDVALFQRLLGLLAEPLRLLVLGAAVGAQFPIVHTIDIARRARDRLAHRPLGRGVAGRWSGAQLARRGGRGGGRLGLRRGFGSRSRRGSRRSGWR